MTTLLLSVVINWQASLCVYVNMHVDRGRWKIQSNYHHPLLWLISERISRRKLFAHSIFTDTPVKGNTIALLLQCASSYFPLKTGAIWGDRVKVDGSCPFCFCGQVWADNCQVCAAETDDYRLYCLSQAQSTLIQQSHLFLIYESLSLILSSPPHPPFFSFMCF